MLKHLFISKPHFITDEEDSSMATFWIVIALIIIAWIFK